MDCELALSTPSVAEESPKPRDGAPPEALKPPPPPRPSPERSDVDKIIALKAHMATMYTELVGQFYEAPSKT